MTDVPPAMFQRPTDPPGPLPALRGVGAVATMHLEWERQFAPPADAAAVGPRLRRRLRSAASKIMGGADGEFLADLVRAVDTVAARCDEISERLVTIEIVVDDLAHVLGEEIAQLRAEVRRTAIREKGTSPSPNL
jgi:hypothetical protein